MRVSLCTSRAIVLSSAAAAGIPEPGTLALVSLAGLGLLRRRRGA